MKTINTFLNEDLKDRIDVHPNFDQLISKPYLYAYVNNDQLEDIKASGINAGKNGLVVYFWRVPQDIKEFQPFLQNKIPLKISISKLIKADDDFKVYAAGFSSDKDNSTLSEDDILKLNLQVDKSLEQFKKGLDAMPRAIIRSGNGLIPNFSFKELEESKMNDKYTFVSESGDRSFEQIRAIGAGIRTAIVGDKLVVNKIPEKIKSTVDNNIKSASEIIKKEGSDKEIISTVKMTERAFPELKGNKKILVAIGTMAVLRGKIKKTNSKTELLNIRKEITEKSQGNIINATAASAYMILSAAALYGLMTAAGGFGGTVLWALFMVFFFSVLASVYQQQ